MPIHVKKSHGTALTAGIKNGRKKAGKYLDFLHRQNHLKKVKQVNRNKIKLSHLTVMNLIVTNNDVDTSQSRDIYYDDDDNQDDDRGNVCHEEVLVNNCKESNRTNSESEATLNLQKVRAQTKLWRKDFHHKGKKKTYVT